MRGKDAAGEGGRVSPEGGMQMDPQSPAPGFALLRTQAARTSWGHLSFAELDSSGDKPRRGDQWEAQSPLQG